MPIKWGKADSSRKYPAFLVFNAAQAAGYLRNSLKLRRSFAIIGLEFHWSVSGKLSKRAEMPFMKLKGKSGLRKTFASLPAQGGTDSTWDCCRRYWQM